MVFKRLLSYQEIEFLKDRYYPVELIELIDITIEELVEAFDEKIYEKIQDGTIELRVYEE